MYATQAQVEGYLGRSLTDEEATFFDDLESAVADYIDLYTGRTFTAERSGYMQTDNTIGDKSSHPFQSFDGGDAEIFFDSPLQTDTTLNDVITPYIGAYDFSTGTFTTIDVDNYTFYPRNSKAKTSVEMKTGVFSYGINNILIYGLYGDTLTAPKGIQIASATLCANFFNMAGEDLKSETIEGYAYTLDRNFNPLVQKLLDSYKRVLL